MPTPTRKQRRQDLLLSDAEFEKALREYTLGSFPHLWDEAKEKILSDRRARTSLMREETQDELHAQALIPEDPVPHLIHLLGEVYKVLEDGPLRDRVEDALLGDY